MKDRQGQTYSGRSLRSYKNSPFLEKITGSPLLSCLIHSSAAKTRLTFISAPKAEGHHHEQHSPNFWQELGPRLSWSVTKSVRIAFFASPSFPSCSILNGKETISKVSLTGLAFWKGKLVNISRITIWPSTRRVRYRRLVIVWVSPLALFSQERTSS